ncbi:MAG: Hpt domain-containing protein, partial [Pseudomonadales bacterium]
RELEDTLNRNADLPDIEVLQNALTQAEDELGQEKAERVRVEKETAAYINELMDDLNKARSEARKEAAARTDAELTVEQRLSALSAELEDTRRRLIAEASARQRAEEKAKAAVSSGQQTKPDIEPEAAQTSAEIQEDHTGTPIKSSMPMNNPILHSMAERFVLRLDEQLDALEAALDDGMPHEMMLITNWLKGEAYTLGFHDFTRPASDLEALLKDQEYTRIPAKIVELKHMAARIELEGASIAHPAGAEAGRSDRSRLRYTLPTNARKAEMMENFIGQLGTQLLEFEAAAASGNTSELTKIIRWILKYASAFELNEITDATQALENSVESTERGAAAGDVAD